MAVSVVATDIPGSQLTIAYTNYLNDSATRKFVLQCGDDGDGRAAVITATKAYLIAENNAIQSGYAHPDSGTFNSTLKVNRISAQCIGLKKWIATVEYVATEFTGFPSGVTTLYKSKVSHESVQCYCAPGGQFEDGLPYGDNGKLMMNPPGLSSQDPGYATDPQKPPAPWYYSRPVLNIQVPFSTSTNPISKALNSAGKYAPANVVLAGLSGSARYDGLDMTSTSNSGGALGSVIYSGVDNYTIVQGTFAQQKIEWDQQEGCWVAENVTVYQRYGG